MRITILHFTSPDLYADYDTYFTSPDLHMDYDTYFPSPYLHMDNDTYFTFTFKIGRASCRERVEQNKEYLHTYPISTSILIRMKIR